jgi:LuxR family maltose regulon positive regulatory protein
VIPLDDSRRWYRYHHLFADVLRAHLTDEQADRVADLHRRASEWFEQNGEPSEAIRHAVAAGDFERAADLAELALPAMRRSRREGEIRDWIRLIPAELVRTRPVLDVGFVGALMSVNEFDGVADRLRDAERSLGTNEGGMILVDRDQFRGLPGMVEMYKAALALVRGDKSGTVTHVASNRRTKNPPSAHGTRNIAMRLALKRSTRRHTIRRARPGCWVPARPRGRRPNLPAAR